MNNDFEILNEKLNVFINKYYKNKILKGIFLVPIFFISIVLVVSGLEYIGWFSINTRFFIFLLSLGTLIYFFISYLLLPIFRYFNLAKRISKTNVSKIISAHFPDVKDSIINVLELNALKKDNELIISSINQKIDKLDKFDFNTAVSFSESFKLIRYLAFSLFILILTFIIQPKVITEGAIRIVNYNKEFIKEIGVEINIDTSKLYVARGDNLELKIELIGDKEFEDLFIVYGGREYLLEHVYAKNYKYLFKNINNGFKFYLKNEFFTSKYFDIKVNDIPILKNYYVELNYPNYLDYENETLHNINNISVPAGTKLNWVFNSSYCDNILIKDSDTTTNLKYSNNTHTFKYLAKNDQEFSITLRNDFTTINSDLSLVVNVVNDLFPSIKVNYVKDDKNFRIFYFKGLINDDYGFNKLKVFTTEKSTGINIPINKNINEQEFYFSYEFPVEHSSNELYFIIYDNDILNGFKSTKSEIFSIKIPSLNEIAKQQNEQFEDLENKLDQSLLLANELRRDIEEIKKSLINENLETWEKEAKLKSIAEKHNQLNKIVNELSKANKEKDNFKNSFTENKDEILDKQKQIQELLDNLMNDDIKELIDELNKLANEFNEKELNQLTDDLELNYEDLSKELDKNLELLKRYEIEESVSNQIEKLKKLSNEQNELSEQISKKSSDTDSLVKQNNEHAKKLNEIKKEYNETIEKNSELEKPLSLDNFNKDFENIKKDIINNNEDLNSKGGEDKANKNSNKLNKLADKIQNMMNSNKQKSAGEDAESLRQLLDNLFTFSFDQESTMNELLHVRNDNPRFIELIKEHNKLTDDFGIIRDSLYALSKRNAALGVSISKAAFNIESELIDIKTLFEKRNSGLIRKKQREILTSSNDMILLLSESLKNMDSMGGGSGSGNNKKKKPKKGDQPSMSDMKKSQESFKQQLENMLNQMKGDKGKAGKTGLKQMGKMLAQQEILQQMMNELLTNGGVGSKATKQLKEIKKLMDANKRDLVNMNISNSTLFRQQQILTRLLEAETAEMERDKDKERESNEAINYKISNPKKLFEDNNENINFNEIFNTKSVNLFDFYKYKYQEYLIEINEIE